MSLNDLNDINNINNLNINFINEPFLGVLIQGDPRVLQTWLSEKSKQSEINSYVVDGKTALSAAVMFAINSNTHRERNLRIHCVRVLLNQGADITKNNLDDSSCFDLILKALSNKPYHANQPSTCLDKLAKQQVSYLLECLKRGSVNLKNTAICYHPASHKLTTPKFCDVSIMANLNQSRSR